jgi:5-methylcytosine-specific restriction endonuclease McrA
VIVRRPKRKHKTHHDWSRYAERNDAVKRIGFCSYANYLVSPLWKSIRERVLKRADHCCCACTGVAWQAHHRHYSDDVLRGDRIDESVLVAICRDCHDHIETDDAGRKVPVHVANKRLKKLQNKFRSYPKPSNTCVCPARAAELGVVLVATPSGEMKVPPVTQARPTTKGPAPDRKASLPNVV